MNRVANIYRHPLMPHPEGWGWRQLMNYFLFSSPARKGGVIDYLKISTSSLNPHELFKINQGISVIVKEQTFSS